MAHRYFIKLSYDGTNYHGWQVQPGEDTVQSTLEKALKTLLKEEISLTGAGRTDTGVHAKEFYAHFDTIKSQGEISKIDLVYKLNSILPDDIAIDNILPVNENAHARFDATERTYHYYICTRKDPFLLGKAWFYYRKPDIEKMNAAAKILYNYTDFTSFSKTNTQTKTNNCNIKNAHWIKEDQMLIFEITADRFLRNMVRAIVGTLVEIGLDKMPVEEIENIIRAKNRSSAGYSVPAHGLFLSGIKYPEEIFIY